MIPVFWAQWQKLKHAPGGVLLMCAMTILFTFGLGSGTPGQSVLPVYSGSPVADEEKERWMDALNRSDVYSFEWTDEKRAKRSVAEGRAPLAVRLDGESYRIIAASDHPDVAVASRYIETVFRETVQLREAEQVTGSADIRDAVRNGMGEPSIRLESSSSNPQRSFRYDAGLQALFGFTLFFVIYTIAFAVQAILEEKRTGIWNRVIMSPVRKTGMYTGHLLYSFGVGYGQMLLIFLLYRYVFGYDLGDRFFTIMVIAACYVFAIVALSMLLTGLVRTPQQFNVLIPLVSVSMAMLGGAYWPIEIVSNSVLLAMSRAIPVTYGMEALKGAALYHQGLADLAEPLAMLVLIGVLCMGAGINLVERR